MGIEAREIATQCRSSWLISLRGFFDKYDGESFVYRRAAKLAWFEKPVLSEPFILREPQDERRVEGLTMTLR